MLDTGVFSLRVFTDENGVDIIVWCLVAGDGNTWPNVGEKVERPSEGQVEGNVTLSNCPTTVSIRAHMATDGTHSV